MLLDLTSSDEEELCISNSLDYDAPTDKDDACEEDILEKNATMMGGSLACNLAKLKKTHSNKIQREDYHETKSNKMTTKRKIKLMLLFKITTRLSCT